MITPATAPTTIPAKQRVYDDAEVKNRNRLMPRLNARLELTRAVIALGGTTAQIREEEHRRIALMERVAYWSRKPHAYIANLDPLGSMCDLCWASVDASQHLLHPIAHVKPF